METKSALLQSPKLLEQVRAKLRVKHYSIRTEEAYFDWIKRFILFHDKRHPADMASPEVEAFVTDLAVTRKVSASTQNQPKRAILLLHREVLQKELAWLGKRQVRQKQPARLPSVLTSAETRPILSRLKGTHWLIASLLLGARCVAVSCQVEPNRNLPVFIYAPL